jgi:hypothetical protein
LPYRSLRWSLAAQQERSRSNAADRPAPTQCDPRPDHDGIHCSGDMNRWGLPGGGLRAYADELAGLIMIVLIF